jgi:Tfp pilus assembly protein PilX
MNLINLQRINRFSDEDGSVMILALLMLAILSIMGVSATTTSTIEVQIAANDKNHKQNFYKAEGGAMEAATRLENETSTTVLIDRTPAYMNAYNASVDMTQSSLWDYDDADGDDNAETAHNNIDPNGTTYFSIVHIGIADGSSLSLGGTNLHEYAIYGLHKSTGGESLVEVGYRKRF